MVKRTNNAAVTTYTPNAFNQAAGSYDNNGNRTSGADGYAYDVENQLVQIEEASSWKTDLVYDGRQRLRIVRDYYWSGGTYQLATETRYLYDGMNLIQQRTSSGHPTVTYTRGRDLSGSLEGAGGIGGLLARSTHAGSSPYQPNTHAFYHADGNGNVTYLRRGDGNYAAYKYDPFGRTLATSGTLAAQNLLRFSSKPWIQNSYSSDGLYYYGYRFYDPFSQRWLNRDPIGEKGGINLYTYIHNHSANAIDPWGHKIIIDPSADQAFKDKISNCLCILYSTPRGKELYDQLDNDPIDVIIRPGEQALTASSPGEYRATQGTPPLIEMNPNTPIGASPEQTALMSLLNEAPPQNDIGCAIVLGHELGHATGASDDPSRGNNVHNNENPIRISLGEETRKTWGGKPVSH